MRPHPRGIDVEMLKKMVGVSRAKNLKSFMKRSFQRVGVSTAEEFLRYSELDPERALTSLQQYELVAMMNALASYEKFLPPSPKSLSPAGTGVLMTGVQRLSPDFAVFRQRAPNVYEGHPFIIETGVAYGGGLRSGVKIYRFANRIPLLYDERSDVSVRVVRDLNLKHYGLRQDNPIAFVVHICSTKIPYKTVGKEFIADVDVIRREVELGFKDCLRELSEKVRKRNRVHKQRKRETSLVNYYQFMSETLSSALEREVSFDNLFSEEERVRNE
jgi:DNA topoisomerase-6 subunit B